MNDVTRDVRLKDLFSGLSLADQKIPNDLQVPDEFYQQLIDYFMERSYLNHADEQDFMRLPSQHGTITWLQITRLPVHPDNIRSYDLLSRWQGTLSTLHAWNYRLLFLLLRSQGETRLYLGTTSFRQEIRAQNAIEQIRQAAFSSMPGVELKAMETSTGESYSQIALPLSDMTSIGAVTGIPSFRREGDPGMLQTLDQLSFGLRSADGMERDYAMLVIADPMQDQETAQLIERMRKLSSKIHLAVSRSVTEGDSSSESKQKGLGAYGGLRVGEIAGGMLGSILGGKIGENVGTSLGSILGGAAGGNAQRSVSLSSSSSVSTQYLDKYAEYAEALINSHIERLKEGRNLGFWNAGVYLLSKSPTDIMTLGGMLRSVYSGEQSYLEPIRVHLLKPDSGALEIVKGQFDLIPLMNKEYEKEAYQGMELSQKVWHLFGRPYQYLSTPMNTKELSLATSLPRRDVPGLRFVKTAVRFANNPAAIQGRAITLGKVVDMGVVQSNDYRIDLDALVRHALVTGATGSGKSTTCKRILSEVMKRDVPVLVLEPAKDDYVRWALRQNEHLPPEKQFAIYMPGVTEFEGHPVTPLEINLFEPAAAEGAKVDLLQHSENLSMLLNAFLPTAEVLPILIEETVFRTISSVAPKEFDTAMVAPLALYPDVTDLVYYAERVLQEKGYEARIASNFNAMLNARFESLMRGMRGHVLNVSKSVSYSQLFSRPAVINISRLAGSAEKSLVMSLLLLALYEYRSSLYAFDAKYRADAQNNRLLHLTLIEEAHNVLSAPRQEMSGAANPQQAAADLFSNMLSEIRGYGQGMVIVDQIPTRLVPDAIKNTNYKIAHRMTAPDDCSVIASGMALREDQKSIISALEIGNAIICGDQDDAAAWVRLAKE